jgi:hypothetical protein
MKNIYILLISFLILSSNSAFSQIKFDDYFTAKTLRFDFSEAGNAEGETFYFEQMKCEPFWGGSKKNLIDKFNLGEYRLFVYDIESSKLIYSRGFSTLFQEWMATDEAKVVNRSFYETVVIPFPKKSVRLEIHKRTRDGILEKKFEYVIDPTNYFINPETPIKYNTKKVLDNGDPATKVDILFLPDGYTAEEMTKFNDDVTRFIGYFFSCSPYKENKNNFNIWLVEAPSQESGTDIPGKHIYKNTLFNSSFYTFNTDRYLMTNDVKSIRDVAANAPYDEIIILVNTNKYGGGGIYNFYCTVSSDDDYSDYVVTHEFGHQFGDLADEYWTSDVAVKDYINLKVEPVQPNITTLVDFGSKWKNMVSEGVPIPTPNDPKYYDKVGVFEGGGYVDKGVYRPMYDCTMKTRSRNNMCPVCKKALQDMINFYSE